MGSQRCTVGASRQRDLLPLPFDSEGCVPDVRRLSSVLSAKSCRKIKAHNHRRDDVNACIFALNCLSDHSFNRESPLPKQPSIAQTQSIDRIRRAVRELGSPCVADCSPSEALAELRQSSDYASLPRNLAPLDLDLLSLPSSANAPVDLEALGFD